MLTNLRNLFSSAPGNNTPRAIIYGGVTNLGHKRTNNEDSFAGIPLAKTNRMWRESGRWTPDASGLWLAVSDGMGGANAGEVASRMAVDGMAARLAERNQMSPHLSSQLEVAGAAVKAVHADIFLQAERNAVWRGMGATVCGLWFAPGSAEAILVNVGDSRLYRLRDKKLEQLSRDQTVAQAWIDQGKITPEQAARSKMGGVLEHALGADGQPIEPQIVPVDLEPGDAFLLCSDGLHGPVKADKIAQSMLRLPRRASEKDATDVASRLIDAALAASGSDNITALIAIVEG